LATATKTPAKWETLPAKQQPTYEDEAEVRAVTDELKSLPGLVDPNDTDRLLAKLAKVAEGKGFILQAGNCAEEFGTPIAKLTNLIKIILQMTMVLLWGGGMEIVKLVRGAGQYAKPRSADTDKSGRKSYRGDMVNGLEETDEARRHDPQRLLTAYRESRATWAEIRRLTTGGMADLRWIHNWNLEFVANTRQGRLYEKVAGIIDQAISFMEACGVDVRGMSATQVAEVFTSHEALVLAYEGALLRNGYDSSAHYLWIGERTRQLDHAHVEFFRHVRNPVGIKVGPGTTPEEIRAYCRLLNPHNIPGKLVFVSRMGATNIDRVLPELMRAAAETGCPVIWQCDPMHGNTIESVSGFKTRRIKSIKREIKGFFRACAITGTHPGGVHLELTGDDVTECLGGHQDIQDADLHREYTTACDPRLNAGQSLQIAFYVAKLLRQHRQNLTLAA
jgi:3-deoxy-7-phosphoheptulonate synthase